ncbi:uncharacterized protein LOC119734156 [Patiria miniata]|uniref:Uncharacterized protein n=1 Tax=Patiria miniata TaxID=46514 RepID=A0A914AII8_PATMI|nr:uncharacterized protein LOC119734156 [Patiria miniata]
MKMMMRSVPVFVFLGLLAFQVALADWSERRTVEEFPDQKRNDESKLMDELISRLLDNKRQQSHKVCAEDEDFYCWDSGCNTPIGIIGNAYVEFYSNTNLFVVSLEYCCDADGYWDNHFEERQTVSDLSKVLPYSKEYTFDEKTYKMTVQSVVTGGSKLSVSGVCVE